MQIFSPLRTRFSSRRQKYVGARGFSLPELLISIAIIGLISSIVLVKYSAFDSTVLAKSAAYEVALALREAQVKSVSVARSDDNFDNPFGVHFSEGDPTFQSFVYRIENITDRPFYDIGISGEQALKLLDTTFDRGMKIGDICINDSDGGANDECGVSHLDVSFRRPEFRAIFYAKDELGVEIPSTAIDSAYIKIHSPNDTTTFEVEVTKLGQISVRKS